MDYSLYQIFSSEIAESLTPLRVLAILGSAIALGLIVSLVYILTHRREGYTQSFVISILILAPIVSIVILLIGNNVARAFSLAGAFALIRFRSAPGDPKDITYVFFSVVTGLACGMGYIAYAAIFTVVISLVMIILHYTRYGERKCEAYELKITIPETLNYVGAFDDIFEKYTNSCKMSRVKTCDFGALFEIVYQVNIKDGMDTKAFLDEIRMRNGNLKISLGVTGTQTKDYHF